MEQNYRDFIESLELIDVALLRLTVERHIDSPYGMEGVASFKHRFTLNRWESGEIKGQGEFDVRAGTKEAPEAFFTIKLVLEAHYKTSAQPPDDERIKRIFAQRNLPINIWPYARETISSLTSRMGYPQLTIGVFKV
ncbi:MAG: hypothetical protein GX825_09500 [Syntrophomonadaceae bacterium]|nr:hypothetical protein [Syntrophomonadaceae bacterium]